MKAEEVKRAVVVGAGVMGHSIAQVFAQAGIEVNLVDVREDLLERAMERVKGNLKTLVRAGRVSEQEVPGILERIHPGTDLAAACGQVDFALEAVAESPEVKEKVFKELEASCPEGTVLASNTSTLDIFEIVELEDPSRLVCAHWFAPPHIIPLVEIAPGPQTSPETVSFTATLMVLLGKQPLVMRTFVPGYIVNRIQQGIAGVVLEMLTKGWASPEEIDLAVKLSLGIRLPIVGVAQTLDFTGLELVRALTRAMGMNVPVIEEKVEQGHLGASTSKGLYDYGGRTEEEILRDRDTRYLQILEQLERIGAFEPV